MPDLVCYSPDKAALIAEAKIKMPSWVDVNNELRGNHTPIIEVQGAKTRLMSVVRVNDMETFGSFTSLQALGKYVDDTFFPFSEVAQTIYTEMCSYIPIVTATLPDGSTGDSVASEVIGAIA